MHATRANNKRIAKNTVMLYIRMVLLMLVNLYTSRVLLNALGVADYGLYSIVGGIVIFLGFINTSMAAASQRFLAYAQGIGDTRLTASTFSSVCVVQGLIALGIFAIGETIGTLYIQYFLNVDPTKLGIAHIVFQFSLLAFITKALTVPYNASIIANEKMDAFAFISIFEGMFQLAAAIGIKHVDSNRLFFYSLFMFLCTVLVFVCYQTYCKIKFKECRFRHNWHKETIRKIFNYSGWNLLGALSSVVISQGINMVLNAFFGVVVNAARGIAFQVSNGVGMLSMNFQQALNPQIVKNYAARDYQQMHKLIITGTRFCYYLLLVLAIPICLNLYPLLKLWLKNVPPYTEGFIFLIVIAEMVNALSGCLMMGAMATGDIKKYQIVVASINLMNLPLSTIALYVYPNPFVTVYVMIALAVIAFFARLWITSGLTRLPKRRFLREAVLASFATTIIATLAACAINQALQGDGVLMLAVRLCMAFIMVATVVFVFGISKSERTFCLQIVRNRLHR